MIYFYLILILFQFAFLKKKTDNQILDKASSLAIKGSLSIFVLFHNVGGDLMNLTFFEKTITEHMGGIGVAIFFFLSAYGIMMSYKKEGNTSLKRLLFKNVFHLYFTSVFINVLIWTFFKRDIYTMSEALLRIFNFDFFIGFSRMNRHGWFILTLISLYFLFIVTFYLCSKLKCEKKIYIASLIVISFTLTIKLLSMIYNVGGMYTRELTGFPLGIIYGLFYDKINLFCKKYLKIITPIFCILFFIGLIFYEPLGGWSMIILIITLSNKFDYKNKINLALGTICLGIYLFTDFSMNLLYDLYLNYPFQWVITNTIICIGLAISYKYLITFKNFILKNFFINCFY